MTTPITITIAPLYSPTRVVLNVKDNDEKITKRLLTNQMILHYARMD